MGEDMFDASKLLGALFEQKAAPSAGNRIDTAVRNLDSKGGGTAGSPSLQSVLASLTGGTGTAEGLVASLKDAAQRAFGSTAHEAKANNPAAVGGLGAVAGALLGGGRGALGGGLLALLGSLAVNALQGAKSEGAAAAQPPPAETEANLILRAVIQATKADGRIDGAEIQRIHARLAESGADSEERAFVEQEMRRPVDIPGLAAEVRSPEQAARVYAASLLAIEVDTPAERDYLARLAAALRLPQDAVARIHGTLGVPA
jgi:uncharacterized membrane protein YebE (DUF533 family)